MPNPRLMATAGLPKNMVWTFADGPLSLGRDTTNQAGVRDPIISRKHCSISEVSTGIFEIVDLESHNGTFVNGTRVSRQRLQHGDRIRIGRCEFVFLTGPDDGTHPLSSDLSNTATAGLKTVSLDGSGLPSDSSWVGRMARDLAAFFRIANLINSTGDVEAMQHQLLALICEVIPAEEGAIVLQAASPNEEPSPACVWNRQQRISHTMVIRDDVVQQAIWDRCAIFTGNVPGAGSAQHVLCVPLVGVERTLGVIYLAASTASPAFGEDHAFFLSSVSRIVAVTLEHLSKLDSLRAENQRLLEVVKSDSSLIGDSRPMLRVRELVAHLAKSDSTVLILGESGTGKELVARAIHADSPRSGKPFVAINCAAIPETLLESELFGHEKGAFTGAIAAKKGKFETAEEGTLFLDEIGEMAPQLQSKLLRVLQQREFERLGGNRLLSFNARVSGGDQ